MKIESNPQTKKLLFLTYALVGMGLLLLFSASKGAVTRFEGIFLKQCIWVVLGTLALLVVRRVDYRSYRRYAFLYYLAVIVCLVLVLLIGEGRASRWIRIGWFNFQPAEFAKLVFIITIAAYVAAFEVKRAGAFIGALIITGIPAVLILKQPNLGTTFVFLLIFLGVLYCAGLSRKQFYAMLTVGLLASPVLWFTMEGYQKERILTFLFPQRDPLGRGYNLLQSKITIGSGGLIGKGFLRGTQTKLAFLPEYHTDFVFCIIGEEFGLIGVLVFFTVYYFFLKHILSIISSTRDQYARLVGAGIFVMFFSQFLINISMTLGLFPVAGIPLPFLSYGGSFMIVSLMSIGVLLNIQENESMF